MTELAPPACATLLLSPTTLATCDASGRCAMQIRRGVHRSTAELEAAIRAYLDAVNADPKPFRWTKSADDILAAIKRFCLKTLEIASAQAKIAQNSESGH